MKSFARLLLVVAVLTSLIAGCAAPTPEVIEKEVVVEKKVIETVEVEKEVVVEKKVIETVEVEKEVTVPPEPVTISVAYWASEAHMIGMNEVVKAFAAKHPNIIMEVVIPPPADYFP